MAWTTPRTWVTSEVSTAANFNTHLRDNLNFLASHHGTRCTKSVDQTVASGNNDVVTFGTETYDTDAMHGATGSRFIASFDGYYRLKVQLATDADTAQHNGRVELNVRKNAAGVNSGGTDLETMMYATHANVQSFSIEWEGFLTAADYVEVFMLSATEGRVINSGVTGSNAEFEWRGF